MQIEEAALPGIKIITPRRFADERGFFAETYNRRTYAAAGIDLDFVQDNHSLSRRRGTVRGLHFQSPPFAQAKLVSVVRGSILDVAVDLRRASPTFGRHVMVEMSAADAKQLLVPIGFAHGFCTLEADTEVLYKVTDYYAPEHDRGLAWDDPALAIPWPIAPSQAILSAKDARHPRLADLADTFP